jgi:hypothetical protein
MSKSDGVPKNDLNPGSVNRGAPKHAHSAKLKPCFEEDCSLEEMNDWPGDTQKPGEMHGPFCIHADQNVRTEDGTRCYFCGGDLPEMTLSGPPPAALNDNGSDDATGSTVDPSEDPTDEHALKCGCPDVALLKESLSRVLSQRDELERRLTAVAAPQLSNTDRRVLWDALSARAKGIGSKLGVLARGAEEEQRALRREADRLLMLTRNLLPEARLHVCSEFWDAFIETTEGAALHGCEIPPKPAEDDIPW